MEERCEMDENGKKKRKKKIERQRDRVLRRKLKKGTKEYRGKVAKKHKTEGGRGTKGTRVVETQMEQLADDNIEKSFHCRKFDPHLAVCCAERVIGRVNEHSAGIHILGIARVWPQRQVEAALVPLPRDLRVKRHLEQESTGSLRF